MAASTSDLLAICFKQICHITDWITDSINVAGLKAIADVKNASIDSNQHLIYYWTVTLGITWLPGLIYFLIFASMVFDSENNRWLRILTLVLCFPLAPLAPLIAGFVFLPLDIANHVLYFDKC